jgi:HlyD family secretion protein
MKKLLFAALILILALAWWFYRQRNAPPKVPFAKVTRGTLVSSVITNGKVEPMEWAAVVAEAAGVVEAFHAERGAHVKRGDTLVELGAQEARSALATAEARCTQARAELEVVERGGRTLELAELDGDLDRANMELDAAGKERASLERLAEKQAVTRQEASEAVRRVERAQLQIQQLKKKRAALVDQADRTAAQAKLGEAETAVELARRRLEKSVIRAPMSGVTYEAAVRTGSYLNPGDLVAKVGRTDKVRVRVYVDEPELGRVASGMPVTITWDALAQRRWEGTVERMPSEISAWGTRQVGEVVCLIDNQARELLPGTNVNAEILSRVAENALSIPREALRRESNESGVLLLQGDAVVWRKVAVGVSSITRVQVMDGLAEGDAVALPGDAALVSGARVKPVFR